MNAEATIAECIEGLLRQKVPPLEVILVDNNSSDRSTAIVEDYVQQHPHNLVHIVEPKPGPSAARNRGAKRAEGQVLAFIDADCIAHRDWIANLSDAFHREELGAVAGRILPHSKGNCLEKFHALFTMSGLRENRVLREFTLVEGGFPTANLAVHRILFEKIGGFDETLKISEDFDLCARIYAAGWCILYSNDICVYHQHRKTFTGTLRQSFGFGVGHACSLKKNFHRLVIVEWPGHRIVTRGIKARLWLDLAAADKKIVTLAALVYLWPPAALLMAFYLLYMLRQIGKRLEDKELTALLPQKIGMLMLLFAKSLAMSSGRMYGSLKHVVCCI
jgi:glycosyltransferase involved in cell wall biosynthesis